MSWGKAVGLVAVMFLCVWFGATLTSGKHVTVVNRAARGGETLYIRNLAPAYYTDRQIRRSIPAWEHAINVDFSRYWHTARYKLVFIGRQAAPAGANVATFLKRGPVKGALAYHDVENGAISITVYSGTGAYYGYDNSVSFTHELEEAAADPDISTVKQGWPYDYIWIQKPDGSLRVSFQFGVLGWFGEVSDPVEADHYSIGGVPVSDFITPAWFNTGGGSRYDFMGVCAQPFWIRPGGYAQFEDGTGWNLIANFRSGVASDRGFVVGERSKR